MVYSVLNQFYLIATSYLKKMENTSSNFDGPMLDIPKEDVYLQSLPKGKFTLYRIFHHDTKEMAPVLYANAYADATMFDDRVIITDSKTFTVGKEDDFLQFVKIQPGNVEIKDFADWRKEKRVTLAEFLLGTEAYNAICSSSENNVDKIGNLIAQNLDEENWTQVDLNIKALLFLYASRFIIADFECRFLETVEGDCEIIGRLYNASRTHHNLLIRFDYPNVQMFGNLGEEKLYLNKFLNAKILSETSVFPLLNQIEGLGLRSCFYTLLPVAEKEEYNGWFGGGELVRGKEIREFYEHGLLPTSNLKFKKFAFENCYSINKAEHERFAEHKRRAQPFY